MSRLKLKATSADMDALHAACHKRGAVAKVDKKMLERVLSDHATVLGKLQPNQVENTNG